MEVFSWKQSFHLICFKHLSNRFPFLSSCTEEYIEVRNGGTEISPLIGRYCFTTPPPIVSQGNHMFIKYFTDVDLPNNGFKAVVKIGNTFMFCKIWFQKQEKILINVLQNLYGLLFCFRKSRVLFL